MDEAADEIERLRAERDRLRENVARCEASLVAWVEAVGECNEDRKRLEEALEQAADALSDASLLDAWADARAALKETGHE
jgi:chromosome segregation ATPase